MAIVITSAGPEVIPDTQFPTGHVSAANNPAEPPLQHRPHAFALMHGDGGAKVAYGELHWRVDSFKLQFRDLTVAVAAHSDHTHGYAHTHTVGQPDDATTDSQSTSISGLGPTGSGSDTVTTAISDATTDGTSTSMTGAGPTGSGSDTVTTSQDKAGSDDNTDTHTSTEDAGSGTADHAHNMEHTHTIPEHQHTIAHTHEHDHTHTIPSHQHSISHTHELDHTHTTDSQNTSTSDGTSATLTHTVTTTPSTVTYCDQASQEAISQITQTVPKVDADDGDPMDATIPNVYHQLSSYGDVYLVWDVDLELTAGSEITDCWVQVGAPSTSNIGEVAMGNATTNRRNGSAPTPWQGTYAMKLGAVNENDKITQNVSGDVVWTTTVLDRVKV